MGVESLSRTRPKARKQYKCRACEDMMDHANLDEILSVPKMTDEEREILRKALVDDKGMIQIGEVYEKQNNKYDGELYTWRAKIDVLKIADKYELLSEPD